MRDVHAGSRLPARTVILAAIGLALSGSVASAEAFDVQWRPGWLGGGGQDQPGPREVTLFISPFGEPFNGEPTAAYPVEAWFNGADADHDGVLNWSEFEGDGRRWFGRLDTDGSGRVDPAEITAYEASLHRFGGGMEGDGPGWGGDLNRRPQAPTTGSRLARGGQHGPHSYGTVAEAGFFNYPEPIKAADVNTDSRITVDEWARATQNWFQTLDADHDGRLTLATLPKTVLQARVDSGR